MVSGLQIPGEPPQPAHRHDGSRPDQGLQPGRRHRLHPAQRPAASARRRKWMRLGALASVREQCALKVANCDRSCDAKVFKMKIATYERHDIAIWMQNQLPSNCGRSWNIESVAAVGSVIRIFAVRKLFWILTWLESSACNTLRRTNEIKRNLNRFPGDFMFQLTREEHETLTSQIAISKGWIAGEAGRTALPYAFTENGSILLAAECSLNSPGGRAA